MSKDKKVRPPKGDAFHEVMEAVEYQRAQLQYILEHAGTDGQPFSNEHKRMIRGCLFSALMDHAEECIYMYSFGSIEHGIRSANNLITRMHRLEEVIQ